MKNRINVEQVWPKGYQAMLTFSQSAKGEAISPQAVELIKIRVSQINSCAFCLDMHTKLARNLGETEQRIYALSAWREAPYFTDAEKAMLRLTEEITLVHRNISDSTYNEAAKFLSDRQIAEIIMTAVVINSWNRIMKATGVQPPL